jgi:hypothetical protein
MPILMHKVTSHQIHLYMEEAKRRGGEVEERKEKEM